MPGFFESMKRIMQGKPVFDPNDPEMRDAGHQPSPAPNPAASGQMPPATPQTSVRKGDSSTFPLVCVKRTSTRINGTNMQVYCRIINKSREEVFLDKIRLLGTTRELDSPLRPGEEREYEVFKGPLRQNERDRDVELDYKTKIGGDYFRAIHDIEFNLHPNKLYSVEDLHFQPPVRDIYG